MDVLYSQSGQVRNKIVFAMSCVDIPASAAMLLSTLPSLKSRDIYGAMGNMTSCRVQGVFVQFSVMALLYNLALSTYFYLTLAREWSEDRVRHIQYWLLGMPLVCGLALAFGAIPYYRNVFVFCHIDLPPSAPTWYPVLFFQTIPNLLVTFLSTAMMCAVCLKVRQQAKRMARWRFKFESTGRSQGPRPTTMDRRVFWQAFLYLSAFYATHSVHFSLLLTAWLGIGADNNPQAGLYAGWVLFAIFTPLQGFWNAFIYFRRRFTQKRRRQTAWCCVGSCSDCVVGADVATGSQERVGRV